MDVRLILILLRKWAWLLILCALIGGGVGYYLNTQQVPAYRSSAQVMIVTAAANNNQVRFTSFNDQQLASTYADLFMIEPVLNEVSARLGYPVGAGGINVSNPTGTQIINISVQNIDRNRAAEIANTLVEVFSDYALELETGRFQTSEQSLVFQIEQTQERITEIETALAQVTSTTQRGQLESIELQIAEIEGEIIDLETEIAAIRLNATLDQVDAAQESEIEVYGMELELERLEQLYAHTVSVSIDPQSQYSVAAQDNAAAQLDGLQAQIVALRTDILLASTTLVNDVESQVVSKESQLDQLNQRLTVFQSAYADALLNSESLGNPNEQRVGQLQTSLSLYQQIYASLLPSYEAVRLARVQNTNEISQIQFAQPARSPISTPSFLFVGIALGLVVAGSIAFIYEYIDDTLKSPQDVTDGLGLPAIGAILKDPAFTSEGIYVRQNPRTPVAEAFRVLRANLEFASVDYPLNSILISSPQPSDGKSTVSINLATTMAQSGKRVVLVDSDLRRPSLHRRLGVSNVTGLTNMLLGKEGLEAIQSTTVDNLSLLTSGPLPPNPSELLSSKKLLEVLELLDSTHDLVVIDAPPFVVSDPSTLAAAADGTVLVVHANKTQMTSARTVIEQLRRANANVVGAVINQVPRRGSQYYGYYYSQYTYYGIDKGDQRGFFGRRRGRKSGKNRTSIWSRFRPGKSPTTSAK